MVKSLIPVQPVAAAMQQAMANVHRGNLAGARMIAEQALQSADHRALRGLLGTICCEMGDLAVGIGHLRSALNADATDINARATLAMALVQSGASGDALDLCDPMQADRDPSCRLWRVRGYILQQQGDPAGAARAYERVVAAAPNDFESWNNLGNALGLSGDAAGGIVALDRAARLRPDILPIRINLGTAMVEADRIAEAVTVFERCTKDFPNDAKAFAELGAAFGHLYRSQDAVDAFTAALALTPDDPDLLVSLGENQAALWDLESAEAAFRKAIAIDPVHGRAYVQLAILFEQTNRSSAFAALLAQAEQKGATEDVLNFVRALAYRRERKFAEGLVAIEAVPEDMQPIRRWQIIGELNDRLDRPKEAFAAFEEMNRLHVIDPSDPVRRAHGFRASLNAERALVTPEWYAGWHPASPPLERAAPVFLVGFPRSGTTLLDTLLMGHDNVQVLEERPPLREIEVSVGGIESLADLDPGDIVELRREYFREVRKHIDLRPDSLLVDKFPMHMNKVPLIHRLFPEARFILAQRHPCDVVLSCYMTSFRINNAMVNFLDLRDAASTYDLSFSYWEQCCAVMPIRFHTLVYEQLVDDQERELRPLFDFLGLNWQAESLDHQRTAAERGTIITASYSQVTEPIYRRAAGRWERYREQMAEVLPILRPWAEKMGYAV